MRVDGSLDVFRKIYNTAAVKRIFSRIMLIMTNFEYMPFFIIMF